VTAVTLQFDERPSALAYMVRAVVPVRRPAGFAPAIEARWRAQRVDARELERFVRMTGGRPGRTLPLLYPHTVGFRLSMAMLTHPRFPVPIWNVLQTRNHVLSYRPIPISARLDYAARVRDSRVLERGAELDLETTVQVDGVLAWESLVTFYVRGRFGEPQQASPLARAPRPDGLPSVAEWTMEDRGHLQFGRLTGDYNGIHLWDVYARRFGFQRALYHPPRVLGLCLAHLPQIDPEAPLRLDAWLKGPVPHGAAVRLHAGPEDSRTVFALYAEEARPSILGRLGAVA